MRVAWLRGGGGGGLLPPESPRVPAHSFLGVGGHQRPARQRRVRPGGLPACLVVSDKAETSKRARAQRVAGSRMRERIPAGPGGPFPAFPFGPRPARSGPLAVWAFGLGLWREPAREALDRIDDPPSKSRGRHREREAATARARARAHVLFPSVCPVRPCRPRRCPSFSGPGRPLRQAARLCSPPSSFFFFCPPPSKSGYTCRCACSQSVTLAATVGWVGLGGASLLFLPTLALLRTGSYDCFAPSSKTVGKEPKKKKSMLAG